MGEENKDPEDVSRGDGAEERQDRRRRWWHDPERVDRVFLVWHTVVIVWVTIEHLVLG
ncbi:hypothetical protein ACIBF1_44095 [Spirillospora sp. NPDC050679]